MMAIYIPLQRDLVEVGRSEAAHLASSAVLWLFIGAAYFLIPLIATLLFSLKDHQTGKCCSLSSYGEILHDPRSGRRCGSRSILAVETIVIALVLLIPTVYWVHLKLPKLRPVIGFLALIPFVVPPIILVVGLLDVFKDVAVLVLRAAVRLPRRART